MLRSALRALRAACDLSIAKIKGSISCFLWGEGKALFRNGGLLPNTPLPPKEWAFEKAAFCFFVRRSREGREQAKRQVEPEDGNRSLLGVSVDLPDLVWKSAMLPLLSSKESRPPRQVEKHRKICLMHPVSQQLKNLHHGLRPGLQLRGLRLTLLSYR